VHLFQAQQTGLRINLISERYTDLTSVDIYKIQEINIKHSGQPIIGYERQPMILVTVLHNNTFNLY
jgi:2-keto-4-pentenoate hydratase